MTENTKLIEALETISKETDVPVKEIIELLTGFCWDEEEAYELKDNLPNDLGWHCYVELEW